MTFGVGRNFLDLTKDRIHSATQAFLAKDPWEKIL